MMEIKLNDRKIHASIHLVKIWQLKEKALKKSDESQRYQRKNPNIHFYQAFDVCDCKPPDYSTAIGKSELYEVSKIREALPQFFAVGAKNLLLLTFGTSLGFPTILIPELQKKTPAVPVTLEEVTWIGSINLFLVPLGGFISGPISQRLGRRLTMMLCTLPFVAAWMVFYYARNSAMLFIAQALTGITGGLLEAPVLTYVAEVTQPHLRGLLSATSTMAVILGVFSQMLTGSLVEWRTLAIINIVFPVICFMSLYMVPESPIWLAGKRRLPEAEKALCWLRGWVTPEHVKCEFESLRQDFEKPAKVKTINSVVLDTNHVEKEEPKRKWQAYKKKTFYIPFALVTFVFFINAFGGIMVMQVFAVVILDELHTPINKYLATVYVGMAQVIGTVICVFIIHFTGKRILSFVSIFFTGLSLLLLSVYGFLIIHGQIDGVRYTIIPTILVVSAAFFSHLGLKMLPWILAGEVFPPDVRSVATGSAGSIGYIFSSIANKLFLYMKMGMTLPGTFLFYAVINFVGVIGLYITLPETEGRTLKEIEDHFAGVQKLKHRPAQKDLAYREKWAATNPQPVNDDFESRL